MENKITTSQTSLPNGIMFQTEDQFKAWCHTWFRNNYKEHEKMLFAVNNNSHNRIAGAKQKALGVEAGVSDLILIIQGATVYIELKLPGGIQSKDQKDFMNKIVERGQIYILIDKASDFVNVVNTLLNG